MLRNVVLGISVSVLLGACGGSVTADKASGGTGGCAATGQGCGASGGAGGAGATGGCPGCGFGGGGFGGGGAGGIGGSGGVAGAECVRGINTDSPTAECGGDEVDWFASPYTPTSDITVDRIEAHMTGGKVALLASGAGAPAQVLFVGSLASNPSAAWIGAEVSPPVLLKGGTLYYIGFQGGCSFSVGGPEPVEYIAPSVNGPWQIDGTDNWTARLIGNCP